MRKEVIRKETRNNIIFTAEELIRERGFNGFSYADIAERLNIRKPAIHYHFPTKFDLGRAVIDQEAERVVQFREQSRRLPGTEQLKYLVGVFYRNSLLHKVCLVGSMTSEYSTFDDYMQLTLQALCIEIMDWVGEFLEKGRTEGGLQFPGESSERAELVLGILLSGLLLNRIVDDEAVFDTMVDRMLGDFGVGWRIADLPEPQKARPGSRMHSYT